MSTRFAKATDAGPVELFTDKCGDDPVAMIAAITAENQRLRQQLQLRNCALNAATSGFMIIDMQRKGRPIAFANTTLAKRAGYEVDELLGKPSSILTPREPNLHRVDKIRHAMSAGEHLRIELQSARKDGSLYWTGVALAPVRDESGKVTHYVSTSADITARIEAERNRQQLQEQLAHETHERQRFEQELHLAQKLESVGRLAAGVAHEINTPIQYIGDSVQFLGTASEDCRVLLVEYRAALDAIANGQSYASVQTSIAAAEQTADIEFYKIEVPKAFKRTREGVERVATIVRAMKEFSHPDATQHEPAEINQALETTLIVANNEYKYVAKMETQFAELPPVTCNIGELNQVFLNLIVNAAHAITEAGRDPDEAFIRIATELDADHIRVIVSDNGCGIPEENINKVFDPFFTTKEIGKGTGQGLAITRNIIVDKHGGTVDIKTEVGVGTTFTLRIPVEGPRHSEAVV